MTNPQTQRMTACPVNRAIVQHLQRMAPAMAPRQVLVEHLESLGLGLKTHLYNLCSRGVLVNMKQRNNFSMYTLGNRASLFDGSARVQPQPVAPAAEPEPECQPPPPWVGQKAPPPQYDVMHAPVYVPPVATPTRPGATAFLACPTRGHRC